MLARGPALYGAPPLPVKSLRPLPGRRSQAPHILVLPRTTPSSSISFGAQIPLSDCSEEASPPGDLSPCQGGRQSEIDESRASRLAPTPLSSQGDFQPLDLLVEGRGL